MIVFLFIAGVIGFYISPSAQYGWQIISTGRFVKNINFNACTDRDHKNCTQTIIEKNKLSDFSSASVLIKKIEKFYDKQKSIIKEEQATVGVNQAINEVLSNMDLSRHFVLTEIKPLFGFFNKDLCILKSGEKDIGIQILDELATRSAKERQTTYEKYPANQGLIHIFVRRQEIINKLSLDIENAFPKSDLAKCAKSYARIVEKIKAEKTK